MCCQTSSASHGSIVAEVDGRFVKHIGGIFADGDDISVLICVVRQFLYDGSFYVA
jgi:hypothetical protein